MFSGLSGSTQYHSTNRSFTGAMVNLSVPAILFHEEVKDTVRCDVQLYSNCIATFDSLNTRLGTRSSDDMVSEI